MSVEKNREIVRRFLESEHTGDLFSELFSPDFVGHGPRAISPKPVDLEGRKQATRMLSSAFPDLKLQIEHLIAEGDKVAAVLTISGHHQGAFRGIPSTGKRVTFAAILVFRLAGGKIVEEWANLDLLALLQQLGALPAPEPSSRG